MSVKRSKKNSKTDLAQIDAMKDSEIDYSDIPKLGAEFFREAVWWPGAEWTRFDQARRTGAALHTIAPPCWRIKSA